MSPDPSSDNPHQHVLTQIKGNLSVAPNLIYRTTMSSGAIKVEWLGEVSTVRVPTAAGADYSALMEAAYVLYSILLDGSVAAADVVKLAAKAGVCKRTLVRAKRLLGVRSQRRGSGKGSQWIWLAPTNERLVRMLKDRDLDDLMDRLCHGDDDGQAQDDDSGGRTRGRYQDDGDGQDDDEEGQLQP